jgi:hypothetical protein
MLWKMNKKSSDWWVLDVISNRKQLVNIWHTVWWKLMPGTEIKVPWPHGWTEPVVSADGSIVQTESSDPNDHYRPWLVKNVGRQGWDWQWDLRDYDIIDNTLTIKFRQGKSKWATVAAIKWS